MGLAFPPFDFGVGCCNCLGAVGLCQKSEIRIRLGGEEFGWSLLAVHLQSLSALSMGERYMRLTGAST